MSLHRQSRHRQDTVALRMAAILHRLGYVRKDIWFGGTRRPGPAVHRPHRPKTKENPQARAGGVCFIDEAYYCIGPRTKAIRQEAIEILLQVMENHRDDLL